VTALGPVTVVAQRDGVAFIAGRRFMSAVPRKAWLELRVLLTRRAEHPRVKVFTQSPTLHINVVRLGAPADLDDALKALLREGFAYGLPAGAGPRRRRRTRRAAAGGRATPTRASSRGSPRRRRSRERSQGSLPLGLG
jgi:hypothetical protein